MRRRATRGRIVSLSLSQRYAASESEAVRCGSEPVPQSMNELRPMMNDWKIMHQAMHRIHAGRRLWRPLRRTADGVFKKQPLRPFGAPPARLSVLATILRFSAVST